MSALHQVRDWSLRGKVPLVFFDEFDCRFNNEDLGWLKYFLSPMQGGTFRDNRITFHLGKAIFVFAGGTSFTVEDFSQEVVFDKINQESADKLNDEEKKKIESFKTAKGPDFVSRLRGYVNIHNINPDPKHPEDQSYLIRRALLLRNLIMKQAPDFFDRDRKRLRIDWGVLQALLKVPLYKHGVRSPQAVLDMTRLSGRPSPPKFEAAALPPREQLKLHVAEQRFGELVLAEVPYAIQEEKVAQAIHEQFIRDNPQKDPSDPSMQPWVVLKKHYQESNLGQARHLKVKLQVVNCAYKPVAHGKPVALVFTADEEERMARLEHERWMLEKRNAGYVYGPRKCDVIKTHPCLLDWEELTKADQDKDIKAMKAIPDLLASIDFEVYRK